MSLIAVGDDGILGILPGSGVSLAGDVVSDPDSFTLQVQTSIIIPGAAQIASALKLPDFYEYFPLVIRAADVNLVERDSIPLYYWDTVVTWDTDPFEWDQVLGPEPILKTTTRIMQLEMEESCKEIDNLLKLWDVNRTGANRLPYIAALLGTPLPSANPAQQRRFLRNLVATYQNKGTPLSFIRLFESLGFEVFLVEQYQRRRDGAVVNGPQMAQVSTDLVQDEPIGTTIASVGPYEFQLLNAPISRNSVKIKVFDTSTLRPRIIIDNGNGGWSDDIVGSINYATGHATFTLPSIPTLVGQQILVTYRILPDSFPDPLVVRYTDRVRSSFVSLTLTPRDPTASLTQEINDRLALYLQILKPAHVVLESLQIAFDFNEDESANLDDSIDPVPTVMWNESLFGSYYRGLGWSATGNGSLHVDPSFVGSRHRGGGEYLRNPITDPDGTGPPYVYPFKRDGRFHMPSAADDYEFLWDNVYEVFTTEVTLDVSPPTTTNFSVDKGAGTALGVGAKVAFIDGPAGGSSGEVTIFTDMGTYYDVTLADPLPVAPANGNAVAFLDPDSAHRHQLTTRQQDVLQLLWLQSIYSGTGAQLIFAGGQLGKIPVQPNTVTLRYTFGATEYEETDDGLGGFSNDNGHLSSASINYTTGDVDVTFGGGFPPDSSTDIIYQYASTTSNALGAF